MTYLIYFLLIAGIVASIPKLHQIEQRLRFQANSDKPFNIVLPQIQQEKTLQEELRLFGQMHQQNDFTYFKANPQLSAQILLKKQNSWSQSLFFVGKEASNLLLEVTITHEKGVQKFDNQSIKVYLINCETNEILFAERIKHLRLFKTQITSELYELRVSFGWKQAQDSRQPEETSKHVRVNMDVVGMGVKPANETEDDGAKTFEKMAFVNDETNRIFMNSLEIWDEVQKHHQQHFQNQEQVYFKAIIELIAVFLINLIEMILLRRALKIKSII